MASMAAQVGGVARASFIVGWGIALHEVDLCLIHKLVLGRIMEQAVH
jgi:hypothetical protein